MINALLCNVSSEVLLFGAGLAAVEGGKMSKMMGVVGRITYLLYLSLASIMFCDIEEEIDLFQMSSVVVVLVSC